MAPLVLLSLAVYGATAAVLLGAAHRWVRPLPRRVALLLAAAPFLFTGRAEFRGEVYAPLDIIRHTEPFASLPGGAALAPVRTPMLSDVVLSMIPWQKAVRESVKHGRLPLWNRFILTGEPLLAVQQAAILHPFTVAGFLLPLGAAWTFQMSARLLLALLSAYLLLREIDCGESASLLGAAGWAFSDFVLFWLGYPVSNALAPFPLLLLGLLRIAREANRRAAALTVAALCLIVAAGHPESLLFAVTAAGAWFLFALAREAGGRRGRALLVSLAAGVFALGVMAVQLFPLAEALPVTWEHFFRASYYAHLTKSVAPVESARHLAAYAVPFAWGESGRGAVRDGFAIPGAYAGALLLPLAAAGLFSRNRFRWTLAALLLLGTVLGIRLRVATDALAALPVFDISFTEYFVFLAAFALCGLAALGADRLVRGEGRRAFFAAAAACALAVALVVAARSPGMRELGLSGDHVRRRTLLELAPLGAAMLLVGLAGRRAPRAAGAGLVVLCVAQRVLEAGRLYPSCPVGDLAPRLEVLDAIPRDRPIRMAAVGTLLVPNVSALYELEDVRGYESMTLRTFVATYSLWCPRQGLWFNRVDDLEKPFLSFLNVGYALVPPGFAPPPGWTRRASGPGADLLENARCLPRAFAPAWIRSAPDILQRLRLLESLDDFGARGVVGPGGEAANADWSRNGPARVTVASYQPPSLDLDVAAEDDAVVATSVPAWPGWKATLDGRPIAPLEYDVAFLGFRVPAGAHRLSLRYRPRSVTRGAAVSLLALAAGAVLLVFPRRLPREPSRV